MAGRDHDTAVKALCAGNVGHAGRCGHMHQVGIGPRGGQTGGQGAFIHIAGAAGVLSDHDAGSVVFAVIPTQEPADLKGVLHRQGHIGFTPIAIGSKIL